jgi:hypothetical protein
MSEQPGLFDEIEKEQAEADEDFATYLVTHEGEGDNISSVTE